MKKLTLALGLLLIATGMSSATEAPTLALGKSLFEATEMSPKGRSCATCHANGKGLDQIGDFNDTELKDIINACLRDAMGAQMMSTESQELESLRKYVRTFQKN